MRCGQMTSATTSGRRPLIAGACWVCGLRHRVDDFPVVNGQPITYGYMGWECRKGYNALDPATQQKIRRRGIARFEREQAEKKVARSV
jgi:hypothetical protein